MFLSLFFQKDYYIRIEKSALANHTNCSFFTAEIQYAFSHQLLEYLKQTLKERGNIIKR